MLDIDVESTIRGEERAWSLPHDGITITGSQPEDAYGSAHRLVDKVMHIGTFSKTTDSCQQNRDERDAAL